MNSSMHWLILIHFKFEKYWSKTKIVLLIAIVLDPSMKTDFIKFYFHTIGENIDMKMRELKCYLKRYYLEYEKIVRSYSFPVFIPTNDQPTTDSTESSTSSLGPICGKR